MIISLVHLLSKLKSQNLYSLCNIAALLFLLHQLISNIAISSLTCRDQSNAPFRIWAPLGFIWHKNDTFILVPIFFQISFLLSWLPLHTNLSGLMISVNCEWSQWLCLELQLLLLQTALHKHGFVYSSLDTALSYITLQRRLFDTSFTISS